MLYPVTISVIVSTYNREKKLQRAIKSIQRQTFTDYEIIIVDDASTDGTQKYCEKLVKHYPTTIRYIRRTENWGKHGRPKNEGIKIAQGEYIAFLDDDNEYLMDHLQVLYNESKQRPDVDVLYGDRWVVDEKKPKRKTKGINSDFDTNRLKRQNYIDTSDVLIKRQALLDVGGWSEELPKFADWELFVRLAKDGKVFLHIPKLITNYYIHEGMNQMKYSSPVDQRTGLLMPTFDPDLVPIWARQTTFGDEQLPRIAIFTLTYDRLEYTQRSLKSLKTHAGYSYDHYIIDNGSTDGTQEWLKTHRDEYSIKTIIENPKNVGISKGSNQALEAIGKEYDVIIKMDNDCELQTEGLIASIADIYRRNTRIVLSPSVEGLIDNAGGPPRIKDGYIGEYLFGFVNHLGGLFCAAPYKVYTKFRWRDDDFLHGMQDTIFSQFCLKTGYPLAYLENHRVMHCDNTVGQKEKFKEYFERRKQEKITKYHNDNGESTET